MTADVHEAEVGRQFDLAHERFRTILKADDPRLVAVCAELGPRREEGPILDLGCGKGRFAARLEDEGSDVVGLDRSSAMIGRASNRWRVLGSSRRLPLASRSLAGVFAVEAFEHMSADSWVPVLREVRRVLRPGGRVVIVDKSAVALDRVRPWLPALLVKRVDEWRGLWMYPRGAGARERWFWPGQMEWMLRRAGFLEIQTRRIAVDDENRAIFHALPCFGRFRVWSATAPREIVE